MIIHPRQILLTRYWFKNWYSLSKKSYVVELDLEVNETSIAFVRSCCRPYLTKTSKPYLSIVKTCLFQILSRHGACFVWTWTCLNQDWGRYEFYHKSRSAQGLIQTCNVCGSDLNRSAPGLTHVCPRSESGLEQICFCDRIHTCLSPDSDMSMSKRNMHHVWTRSDEGKILRCSDLVSMFFWIDFHSLKFQKDSWADRFKGLKTILINFCLQTKRKNKLFKRFIEMFYIQYFN